MENKKEETSFKRITTPQIIIITIFIIGTFVFLILSKTSNIKSQELVTNVPVQSVESANVTETSAQPVIDSNLKDPVLDSNFICPQNYESDQSENDALKKFIKDYIKNFPETTISDMFAYRYSLLVKNNCKEALEYIKIQAKGEDPSTYYVEDMLKDIKQTLPNSNESIVKEKTIADIVTEWTSRVVFIICKWTDPNTGKILEAGRGSGTLNYFSDNGYNIITNRHVVTNKQGVGANECTTLFPWDKDFTVSSDGIGRGITEDYGFIKLPDDPFLSKFPKESFKTCPLNSISIGDKLVILGFPSIGAESTITATEGIISGVDQNYFITSAKIDQGNSGGAAILIKDDCYLGIPSSSMVGGIESLGRILKWTFAIN